MGAFDASLAPLRTAPFRRLWYSSWSASGAQLMERTVTAWLALQTGDAFTVGLVFAARSLPSLLLSLATGTIADRSDRRKQLIAVAGAGSLVMLLITLAVTSGAVYGWRVVLVPFAAGCYQVFETPARQALVLDTVPRAQAPSALALNALAARSAGVAGALGAGLLIPHIGVGHCYLVIAGLYALTALLAFRLQVPADHRAAVAHPPFRQALRDAGRLIVGTPAVLTLTISGIAAEIFAFSHGSALPVFAKDVLGGGAETLGLLNAAVAIGGALGLVLLTGLVHRIRREPLLGAIFVLYGLSLLAVATTRVLWLAFAVLIVTGICAASFDVLQQTLLQLSVPEDQRGRAVGIWVLGVGSAPVGYIEMGALITRLGAPSGLLINGLLTLAAAAVLLVRAPVYRWRARPDTPPA